MAAWAGPPLLVATRSAGKLRELKPMLASLGIPMTDLEELGLPYDADEEAIEQFETFEANALAKAHYFYEASGGIATVADDSGLEVLALGGAPGVRSKRWAGAAAGSGERAVDVDAANNAKLVETLATATDRRARYVCAAAYVGLGGDELVRLGTVTGTIVLDPRGREGFGYDPYFLADDLGCTFGEATREAKSRVSHRARAFHALLEAVTQPR